MSTDPFDVTGPTVATDMPPSVADSPANSPWYRRHDVLIACAIAALGLLAIGIGIGKASSQSQISGLKDKNTALEKQVNSRAAKQQAARAAAATASAKAKADTASAKRVKAEQDKKAADAAAKTKAAADKTAADATAAAKAQQDAAAAAAAKMDTITSDGVYQIGVDTSPGHWKTDGGAGCYYAVLNSTNTQDIATNNIVNGPATIDLPAGKYFDTTSCGTWTRVG